MIQTHEQEATSRSDEVLLDCIRGEFVNRPLPVPQTQLASHRRAQRWQGTLSKGRSFSAMASFSSRLPDRVAQMSDRVDKRRRVNFSAQTTDETLDELRGVLVFALPHALA